MNVSTIDNFNTLVKDFDELDIDKAQEALVLLAKILQKTQDKKPIGWLRKFAVEHKSEEIRDRAFTIALGLNNRRDFLAGFVNHLRSQEKRKREILPWVLLGACLLAIGGYATYRRVKQHQITFGSKISIN